MRDVNSRMRRTGAASMLADGVMDDADWELFDLADEVRGAAVELLRALDGDA